MERSVAIEEPVLGDGWAEFVTAESLMSFEASWTEVVEALLALKERSLIWFDGLGERTSAKVCRTEGGVGEPEALTMGVKFQICPNEGCKISNLPYRRV